MTRLILVLATLATLSAPPASALELPTPPPAAATGEVRFTTTAGRYYWPGIGELRFVGAFPAGDTTYIGTVRGGSGTFDPGSLVFEDIRLASDDGRLVGICTSPYYGIEVPPGSVRTMDCDITLDGGPASDLALTIVEVAHTTTGDGIYEPSRTTHDGVFAGQ